MSTGGKQHDHLSNDDNQRPNFYNLAANDSLISPISSVISPISSDQRHFSHLSSPISFPLHKQFQLNEISPNQKWPLMNTPDSMSSGSSQKQLISTPGTHYYNGPDLASFLNQYSTPTSQQQSSSSSLHNLHFTPNSCGSGGAMTGGYRRNMRTPNTCGAFMNHRMRTPSGPLYNPFENLSSCSNFKQSFLSPNMFSCKEPGSCEKESSSFRWTVDQLAILKPAKINEQPKQANLKLDDSKEEEIQQAINEFFAKNSIVPSPWNESIKMVNLLNKEESFGWSPSLTSRAQATNVNQSNVSSQTNISLPIDFDLQSLVGEHYKTDSSVDLGRESPANVSLRRKLFNPDDNSLSKKLPEISNRLSDPGEYDLSQMSDNTSPPASPPRSLPVSPDQSLNMEVESDIEHATPSSSHFSSSPIQSGFSHARSSSSRNRQSIHRSITAPDLLGSTVDTALLKKRYAVNEMSASPSGLRSRTNTNLTSVNSNILPESPGMSPILQSHPKYTPVQDSHPGESAISRLESLRVPIPIELQMSATEFDLVDDDAEEPIGVTDFRSHESLHNSCSYNNSHTNFEENTVGMTSQDTGYHTNSLQMTGSLNTGSNQESLGSLHAESYQDSLSSLHSSLTNQFSCLPLSSEATTVLPNPFSHLKRPSSS